MRIKLDFNGSVRLVTLATGAQGPQGPIGALNADDRAYVDAAKASSGASEGAAAASAATASAAQISSTASAAAAAASEVNAAASESSASTSAGKASAAATNLVTALAAFREVYLGDFSADPAVDGNGQPLKSGAEYFNTTTSKIRVYSGGAWQDKDAAEQQETTNAALSAAAAAAAAAAAGTSETNAAGSAATASAGAATVAAAVTASAASATAAEASASSANADKTAAATSAAAAAQSAIDAENNAGGALPLAGGILTGPVTSKYASPTYTMADASQAGGAGVFRWTSAGGVFKFLRNTAAGGDFSNSTTPLSIDATDVATFSQRPLFGVNIPWDKGNLVAPLAAADNLNSVADKPTARKNLGVGRTLISTQTVSASTSQVVMSGMDATYDEYELVISELLPATNAAVPFLQFSSDGGATFLNTAVYQHAKSFISGVGGTTNQTSPSATYVPFAGGIHSATNLGCCAVVKIFNPGSTTFSKSIFMESTGFNDDSNFWKATGGGFCGTLLAINALRIGFIVGGTTLDNVVSGKFSLYGINK